MRFHMIFIVALGLAGSGCSEDCAAPGNIEAMTSEPTRDGKPAGSAGRECGPAGSLPRTAEPWRERLTPEQFEVTRLKGTEPPFTGRYWNEKTPGIYRCVCCGAELFRSETKFDSGSGWPSFTSPAGQDSVKTRQDLSAGLVRTEVLCRRCDAHLGHVFEDGPAPAGLRYCINSAALELVSSRSDQEASGK